MSALPIEIECGFKGCTAKAPMTSKVETQYNIGEFKRQQQITKSAAPLGWGYVPVHNGIRRAYCRTHKFLAAKLESIRLALEASNVKKPVVQRMVRRGR